jgi:hypothetical protein
MSSGKEIFQVLWEQTTSQNVSRIPLKADNVRILLNWFLEEITQGNTKKRAAQLKKWGVK